MQNGNARSVVLLQKLAERLGPEALSKLAAETLTAEDIAELQKEARVLPHELRQSADASAAFRAAPPPSPMPLGPTVANPSALAGPVTPLPKAPPGGVWDALGAGNLGEAGRAAAGQADTVWQALKKAPGQAFGEGGPGVAAALKRLGGVAHANPAGAAAIGLPTAALAYLAYKALSDRGQKPAGSMGDAGGYGEETEMKLSSWGLT